MGGRERFIKIGINIRRVDQIWEGARCITAGSGTLSISPLCTVENECEDGASLGAYIIHPEETGLED